MPDVVKSRLKPPAPKRRFGLEFEHISKLDITGLTRELAAAGLTVDSQREAREYSGWQVKHDGSITPVQKYPNGLELTSPPSHMTDFLDFRKALAIASKKGAVNSSCGLHVHIHAPELARVLTSHPDREWQEYVKLSWLAVEKTMFSYMPPSRRLSTYCRPGIHWTTKYQAINFLPLHDHRQTIEFRLHNSTLNPVKAVAWASLCRGLVEAMVNRAKFPPELPPTLRQHTKPTLIRTPHGGEFYLQRDKNGQWLIETKKLKVEMPELNTAFKELRKELKLTGKSCLAAFHYPHYGNAMTELCELANVNGMFRGYIEDRYDRIVKRHGTAEARSLQQRVMADEADFYHEPDYDPNDTRLDAMGNAELRLDQVHEEADGDDDRDDEDDTDNDDRYSGRRG